MRPLTVEVARLYDSDQVLVTLHHPDGTASVSTMAERAWRGVERAMEGDLALGAWMVNEHG